MSKLDEKVGKYIQVCKEKGIDMDPDLLRKVTRACGPSVYNRDAETIAASDPKEMARIRKNLLVKKFGLDDGPELDQGMTEVIETYGRSDGRKYRAVIYYMLAKHFGKDGVYGS